MFKKMSERTNLWFAAQSNRVLIGFLILIPGVIIAYVLVKLYLFLLNITDWFIFFVSKKEIHDNFMLWHVVGFVEMIFVLWFFGRIKDWRIFGRTVNQWFDTWGKKIPLIAFIYGIVDGFAEGIKQKLEKKKMQKQALENGQVVLIPNQTGSNLQIGIITDEREFLAYSYEHDAVIPHVWVNFPPAFAVAGNYANAVAVEKIKKYREKSPFSLTASEALTLAATGGKVGPARLYDLMAKTSEAKIA